MKASQPLEKGYRNPHLHMADNVHLLRGGAAKPSHCPTSFLMDFGMCVLYIFVTSPWLCHCGLVSSIILMISEAQILESVLSILATSQWLCHSSFLSSIIIIISEAQTFFLRCLFQLG